MQIDQQSCLRFSIYGHKLRTSNKIVDRSAIDSTPSQSKIALDARESEADVVRVAGQEIEVIQYEDQQGIIRQESLGVDITEAHDSIPNQFTGPCELIRN